MAFNFLKLPREAQKAAFAHMGDKPKGKRLGTGERHRKMAGDRQTVHAVVAGDTFVKPKKQEPTEEDMKAVRRARLTAGGRLSYQRWRRAGETHENALIQARADDKKIRDAQAKMRAGVAQSPSTFQDTKGRTVTISTAEKADVKAAKLHPTQQMLYTQNRFNGVSHERSLELARASTPDTKRRTSPFRYREQEELRADKLGPVERATYAANRAQGLEHDDALAQAIGKSVVKARIPVSGETLQHRNNVRSVMNDVVKDFPDELTKHTTVQVGETRGVKTAGGINAIGLYNSLTESIRIDPNVAAEHGTDKSRRDALRGQESGFKVPSGFDSQLTETLTHEFGHHLDHQLTTRDRENVFGDVGQALGFDARKPNESVTDWMTRNKAKVVNNVGTYAGTNDRELMAELWTEYAGRGQQARPPARIFGEFVTRKLAK